ncbi:hypothetical protein C9374_002990 [Naegleria lovaniensis]|uniref:Zn(2)-C6 fungal-type domain-containing protein n=1 Tax=Naegleria lovaniensis TaxID=51637 RepID=A0AA88KLY8_NAELO|nr:uncharacterized protein C9374_002990 [Naegleria lovaniensis]KAG2385841.1 hypothetical protein C9374_002990 [Naegleria lovaniensis]
MQGHDNACGGRRIMMTDRSFNHDDNNNNNNSQEPPSKDNEEKHQEDVQQLAHHQGVLSSIVYPSCPSTQPSQQELTKSHAQPLFQEREEDESMSSHRKLMAIHESEFSTLHEIPLSSWSEEIHASIIDTFQEEEQQRESLNAILLENSDLETMSANFNAISCITCRRGHKRCGRQLPACHECTSKGKICVYPEAKKRGRTVGSKNKIQKKKPVTISVLGLESFEKGKQNHKCVSVSFLTPQQQQTSKPMKGQTTTTISQNSSETLACTSSQQASSSTTTTGTVHSTLNLFTGHVKTNPIRKRKANSTTTPTTSNSSNTPLLTSQEKPTLNFSLIPSQVIHSSSTRIGTNFDHIDKSSSTTLSHSVSTSHGRPTSITSSESAEDSDYHSRGIQKQVQPNPSQHSPFLNLSFPSSMTLSQQQQQPQVNVRDEMNQRAALHSVNFHNLQFDPSSHSTQEDHSDHSNQAPVNSENQPHSQGNTSASMNSHSATIERILQLFRYTIQNNADPSVINRLLSLLVKLTNASQIMPLLQQQLSMATATSTVHSNTNQNFDPTFQHLLPTTINVQQSLNHTLPQVIDDAVYCTFERNAVLSQVVLQQQTVDLFFGVVSAGVSIIPRNTFQTILAEREKYGSSTQYFSLLYAIQSFCYQRFGNNENAIRSFYRSKELLFSEYLDLDRPSYLVAAICCYLASYAAASSMDQDATELVAITRSYLSQIKEMDDSLSCLKRGCVLATFITQDFDYEQVEGVSNYIQRKLLEGYKYSTSSNTVPEELMSILSQPLTKDTLPKYLYFVDKIYECYTKYDNAKKNVQEKGKILAHLIISITMVSYRLGIYRELGLRGRELRSITEELTRLSSHPLFGHIPPFLLSGIALGWKAHAEAIEEIEHEVNQEDSKLMNNDLRQQFLYYHDMLERDLLAASLLGKRFVKVFRGFGHVVQRMIDCARRKTLIIREESSFIIQPLNTITETTVSSLNLKLDLESLQTLFTQFNQ